MSTLPAPVAAPGRIASAFAAARERGEALLIAYVMAGDPDPGTSRAGALACIEAGAGLLEIGMPFSDPIADGPTLQGAAERSLAHGTTVADALSLAAEVRRRSDVPIALMGYVNPVIAFGLPRFFSEAARSGVDAVILPDVPPEEAGEVTRLAAQEGVRTVFLLAPTSPPARREAAAKVVTGFLYFVSVTGVTGARRELPPGLAEEVRRVREVSPVPVVVGFGVSTPRQAAEVAKLADGVVVGSAIVSRLAGPGGRRQRVERVRRYVRSLARAMRR